MDDANRLPLAGRRHELEVLAAARSATARGTGGLIAMVGEPGIGKTRLAEDCSARAVHEGFAVAWGSGWPHGGAPPLWPWQGVLEQLGAFEAAAMLDGGAGHGATVEPERFARFRSVSAAIARSSASRPVLVVLDDAHAADPGALQLARFVVRSLRSSPVLVLLTCREVVDIGAVDVAEALTELIREGTLMTVGQLDAEALGEMLRRGHWPASNDEIADLLELTGGNPLFVREALASAGASRRPGSVLNSGSALLRRRLHSFDDGELTILATAALLGTTSSTDAIAAVLQIDPDEVRSVRRKARTAGLLRTENGSGYTFAHGLLSDAVLASVEPEQVTSLRWRAADTLAARLPHVPTSSTVGMDDHSGTPAALDRRTEHDSRSPRGRVEQLTTIAGLRLEAAAQLGGPAIGEAVAAARLAARADVEYGSFDSSAPLLRAACRLLDERDLPVPDDLLVELGQAEFARGRLADSRLAFRRVVAADGGRGGLAADVAVDLAPPSPAGGRHEAFAAAVIGLGGLSLFEHRSVDDIADYRRLVRRATDRLGQTRPDLRARLETRRAAEVWFEGSGTVQDVFASVGAVRTCGDEVALADSLSVLHHVLLGPEYGDERRRIAAELSAVAPHAGDAFLALMGAMWSTVNVLLSGDIGAERAIAALRQRADALRVGSVLYVVELMETMQLTRAGRIEDAEAAANRSFSKGVELGEADAAGYYAGQLMVLRWLQARTDEIVDLARSVVGEPTLLAGDEIYAAAFAAISAIAAGRASEEARAQLDRLMHAGLDRIPTGSNWMLTLFCVVEAAGALADREAADAAYRLLQPYEGLPVVGSLGSICLGPVSRVLGSAALAAGRVDDAVAHLQQAVVDGRQIGNRPVLAITRGELGLALLKRGLADERSQAGGYVQEAIVALTAMGLQRRADALRRQFDAAAAEPPVRTNDGLVDERPLVDPAVLNRVGGQREEHDPELRRRGRRWEIAGAGERALLDDAVGLRYLARLLAQPGVEFSADELAGGAITTRRQEVLDPQARRSFLRRVDVLRADLDAADQAGDAIRSARAQTELDQLIAELDAQSGVSGRQRAFADSRERARTAVHKALRRSIRRIEGVAPRLGSILGASIRTGVVCVYEPSSAELSRWHVTLSDSCASD